jgi:hypothetical protein
MNSWDQLQFLIGSWSSPVSGQPGQGVSGSTTFSYDLDQKIIVRKSRAEFAREPGVVFESEAGQASPRARLVYEAAEEDTLVTEFFVATPGGELPSHVKGTVRRSPK